MLMFHSFAYVEFAEPSHVEAALAMDNSLFKGRLIKVCSVSRNIFSAEVSCTLIGHRQADQRPWF